MPTGNVPEAPELGREKILVPNGVRYKGVHCECYEQPISKLKINPLAFTQPLAKHQRT